MSCYIIVILQELRNLPESDYEFRLRMILNYSYYCILGITVNLTTMAEHASIFVHIHHLEKDKEHYCLTRDPSKIFSLKKYVTNV